MMRTWLFFRLADGEWDGQSISADESTSDLGDWVVRNTPEGCGAFEAKQSVDTRATRLDLDAGQVVSRAPSRAEVDQMQADSARQTIAALERAQAREVREALLQLLPDGSAKQRLMDREALIADQREVLQGLGSSAEPSRAASRGSR